MKMNQHFALTVTALGWLALSTTPSHAGLMNPTDLPGLQLWFDAQDIQGNGTSTIGGQTISTWNDKSGNNRHAIATGGAVDTFVFNDGTLNDGAVLRLNGSNYFQAPLDISRGVMPDVTVVAVYDYRAMDGSNDGLWGQDNGGWDRFSLLNHTLATVPEGVSHGSQMFRVDELDDVARGFDILTTFLDVGALNGSTVRINGNTPSLGGSFTETAGNAGTANLAIGSFGVAGNALQPSQVDFAEFLVFDRLLTPAEENDLGFYLGQKYNITTAYIPEPSTFGLLALGGIALLTCRNRRR